jgi:hypothetical protein
VEDIRTIAGTATVLPRFVEVARDRSAHRRKLELLIG